MLKVTIPETHYYPTILIFFEENDGRLLCQTLPK